MAGFAQSDSTCGSIACRVASALAVSELSPPLVSMGQRPAAATASRCGQGCRPSAGQGRRSRVLCASAGQTVRVETAVSGPYAHVDLPPGSEDLAELGADRTPSEKS